AKAVHIGDKKADFKKGRAIVTGLNHLYHYHDYTYFGYSVSYYDIGKGANSGDTAAVVLVSIITNKGRVKVNFQSPTMKLVAAAPIGIGLLSPTPDALPAQEAGKPHTLAVLGINANGKI